MKLFKRLLRKIHWAKYHYHSKKARKCWYKIIGANKYLPDRKMKKELKAYFNNDKNAINSVFGMFNSSYADTDSVGSADINSFYPSITKPGIYS